MEIKYSKNKIELNKELNRLDEFVIDFTSILNKHKIKYVIVSGYVAILFGRSRESEDIDIIIERINKKTFIKLWSDLQKYFECIITDDVNNAYDDYLYENLAIRFSYKDKRIPNIEIKFPKTDVEEHSLNTKIEVNLNNKKLFISSIELQISYKLYLGNKGNEKDIEDAKHLYIIFENNLNTELLKQYNKELEVERLFNKYIK